jgi:peptidyl-prolyl cis-trans isomerase B (cyclophilin B)
MPTSPRSLIAAAFRKITTPVGRPTRADDGCVFEHLEERQLMTIVVNTPISDASTTRGATPTFINLNNRYTDNWVTSVVRFVTNSGNMDIALFGGAAPNTVANFLNYVTTGAYNNTIFHREQEVAANGIGILQGGGFHVPAATYVDPFPASGGEIPQPVATNAAINLEHPTGNTRGTIAMARTTAINSANSQFFFNTANNSAALDDPTPGTPDAGYSVFGQLTAASLAILDALAAYQNSSFQADFESGGNGGSFGNLPLHKAPVNHNDGSGTYVDLPVAPSDYLQITSATVLADSNVDAVANNFYRSIEIISSNPNIATGAVVGGSLVITPNSTLLGTTTISVRITGLDGTVVTDSFDFTVAPAAPVAGGMQGQANIPVGHSMLVSAFGVRDTDVTGGGVSSVSFYFDSNDNGSLDGADALLGTDNSATGGWNARIDTTGMDVGANRIFARVTDSDTLTATTTMVVNLRAAVSTGTITPDPGSTTPGSGIDITIDDLPGPSGTRRVSIFLDSNNDGVLNPLTDRLIGHATYSNGGSNWIFTVAGSDLSLGTNRIFARATDTYGNLGAAATSTIDVGVP